MFILELSPNDQRILAVTAYKKVTSPKDIMVDTLPKGDVTDYKYINNEYIYEPLPKNNIDLTKNTFSNQILALQAQNDELTLALADVYGGNVQ